MVKGIDNIGIAVKNLARSVAFYEQLGFSKGYDYEGDVQGCTMNAGSAVFFLFKTKLANAQAVNRDLSLAQNPTGLDHISFVVEDVDAIYKDLKAKGVAFQGEPADQDWGARLVSLKDPDGNNLYFLKYLG